MITYDIEINQVEISCSNKADIPTGNENYIQFNFVFDNDWNSTKKLASFRTEYGSETKEINNNMCYLPTSIVKSKGLLKIGVYGINDDTTISTKTLNLNIVTGGYSTDTAPEPNEEIFKELIKLAAKTEEQAAVAAAHAAQAHTEAERAALTAQEANDTADNAKVTAEDAKAVADGIDGKAQNAINKAADAVTASNDAKAVADGANATAERIDGKAQDAVDKSIAAVATANDAKNVANGIDAKAQDAVNKSTSAVTVANNASAQVAGAVQAASAATAAVNDLQIGGRNLLKKSGVRCANTAYPTAKYDFGNEKPAEGETYTIQIKGQLGEGKAFFGIYNSGVINMASIYSTNQKNGVYSKTFKWAGGAELNRFVAIYPIPGDVNTITTIEWIKLEKGNKATDWTPAPEDIDEVIANQAAELSAANGKITTLTTESTQLKTNVSVVSQKLDSFGVTLSSTKAYTDELERIRTQQAGYKFKLDIVVHGDTDKYYPVVIKGGDQYVARQIVVKRSYSQQAPPEWNPSQPIYRGTLNVVIKCSFGGWGGTKVFWQIDNLQEKYCTMFAGAEVCGNEMAFAIFLRGGGETGAVYQLLSDQSLTTIMFADAPGGTLPSPQICYNSDLIFYSTEKYQFYAPPPRVYDDAVITKIKLKSYVDAASESVTKIETLTSQQTKFTTELISVNARLSQLEEKTNNLTRENELLRTALEQP